jgi:hypothetical protein
VESRQSEFPAPFRQKKKKKELKKKKGTGKERAEKKTGSGSLAWLVPNRQTLV